MTDKNKNNLSTETFKLNTDIQTEKEIRELLDMSTNKSGLIKDALSMYRYVVLTKGYVSPYLKHNTGNWDVLFNNLDNNINGLIGRQAEEVKQEIIQTSSQNNSNVTLERREEISLNVFDDEDDFEENEENEDNDIDY